VYAFWPIAAAVTKCLGWAYAPAALRQVRGAEYKLMINLTLIVWLLCAFPIASLIGYCALGEE
jgi:hypothetical protein